MIAAMIGKSKTATATHEDMEKERSVLEMCEQLDAENQQAFSQMKAWANQKLERKIKLQGKHEAKKEEKKKLTFAERLKRTLQLRAKGVGKGRQQKGAAPDVPAAAAAPGPVPEGPLPHMAEPPRPCAHVRVIPDRRVGVTPRELKDLLPGRGLNFAAFQPFRNDAPDNLYYRVTYKLSS